MADKLQITLKRSPIGRPAIQGVIARTLGLRKLNDRVIQDDTPAIRGMIRKVSHLLEVKELQ